MTASHQSVFPALVNLLGAVVVRTGLLLRGILLAGLFVAAVQAEGISINKAEMRHGEEGYQLYANYGVNLTLVVQQALSRGVPLHFVSEFSLTRSRWYWMDEEVFRGEQTAKLSYSMLTRQYRISRGALFQNFASFEDALNMLARQISPPISAELLKKNSSYTAAVRLRLDTAQLPKLLQVNALTGKDWTLNSDWYYWVVHPADIVYTESRAE
ncbi:MAG: DUF4390 domain-containing protein [Gallionellaceae bacterium]|jgi:hypothetical protein|nr:DUF4390 domain-containing protein [Gallionellaceae bacterium]